MRRQEMEPPLGPGPAATPSMEELWMEDVLLKVRNIFRLLPPGEREEILQELSQPPPAPAPPPSDIVEGVGCGYDHKDVIDISDDDT